jgi:hypothetical protein
MSDESGSTPEGDGFDDIVKGSQGPPDKPKLHFRSVAEAVQQVYPILYDGVLIRSMVIYDRLTAEGERELMWIYDANTQPWEALGMVQQVRCNMDAENQIAMARSLPMPPEDEEGEQ